MNKQELIERIDSETFVYPLMEPETEDDTTVEFKKGFNCACENIKRLVQQKLDEPKKVILPKTADDFIKEGKGLGSDKVDIIDSAISFSRAMPDDEFSLWFKLNKDLFVDAVSNGYEVEKEQLYYVKLPEIGYMRFGKKYFYSTDKEDAKRYTENQI